MFPDVFSNKVFDWFSHLFFVMERTVHTALKKNYNFSSHVTDYSEKSSTTHVCVTVAGLSNEDQHIQSELGSP